MEEALANAAKLNEELAKWLLLCKGGEDHHSTESVEAFVGVAKELENYFVSYVGSPSTKETLTSVSATNHEIPLFCCCCC
jgi:hypothetical protein